MFGPSGFFQPFDEEDIQDSSLSLEVMNDSGYGFNILYRGNKNGRFFVYKALKPEFRGNIFYEELLRKDFNIGFSLSHTAICQYYAFINIPQIGNCIVMDWIDGCSIESLLSGGNVAGGNVARGSLTGGNVSGGNVAGGNAAKGSLAGGNVSGGNVAGGNVARGSLAGGNVARGKLRRELAKKLICEICDGLDYMHKKQIIHRDLKPENVLVTYNGLNVKLIDFGLSDSDSYNVYKQSAGTKIYASPELLAGEPVDSRTDIWSLGKMIYEMSGYYSRVAEKCMARDREKRYQSAAEVKEAVLAEGRRRFVLGASVSLAASLAVVAFAGITSAYNVFPGGSDAALSADSPAAVVAETSVGVSDSVSDSASDSASDSVSGAFPDAVYGDASGAALSADAPAVAADSPVAGAGAPRGVVEADDAVADTAAVPVLQQDVRRDADSDLLDASSLNDMFDAAIEQL